MAPLPIVYQDDFYVAVDKPPGMLVHRTRIAEADDFVLQRLRNQLGRRVYPVHRLDRPTSGVLLFGLSPENARALAALFEAREVKKRYLAVVRGHTDARARIDYPLREAPGRAPQQAVTDYRCLGRTEIQEPVGRYDSARYSLLEIFPLTGRMHQIRKHMKHIFHPIIGDTTHGDGRHNELFRRRFNLHQLMLRAVELAFVHPYSGTRVVIEVPADEAFERLGRLVEWNPVSVDDGGEWRWPD